MRSAPSPPTATGSIAAFAAWIPSYRVVRDRRTRAEHIAGTITNERWHTAWLLLGLVTTASALATGQHGWAIAITIFNVAFNLYPVLPPALQAGPAADGRGRHRRYFFCARCALSSASFFAR